MSLDIPSNLLPTGSDFEVPATGPQPSGADTSKSSMDVTQIPVDYNGIKLPVPHDVNTQQPIQLPLDQLTKSVLDGSVSFPKDSEVGLVDNLGKKYSVPATSVQEALQQGFALQDPYKASVERAADLKDPGALGSFAQSGIDSFLFGVPDALKANAETPFDAKVTEAINQQHRVANALGTVVGIGANIAATRGLGLAGAVDNIAAQAVSKIPSKIAQTALSGGIQGAIYSAPLAVTEASLGNYDAAAESFLLGTAGGGALNVIFGHGIPALGRGASAALDSAVEKIQSKLVGNQAQDLGLTTGQLANYQRSGQWDSVVDTAKKYGLFGNKVTPEAAEMAGIKAGESTTTPEAITGIRDSIGGKLDTLYTNLDNNPALGATFDPRSITNDLQAKINELSPFKTRSSEVSYLNNVMDSIGDQPAMGFKDAIALRQNLFPPAQIKSSFQALRNGTATPLDQTVTDAYGLFQQNFNDSAAAAIKNAGPDVGINLPDFLRLKKDYVQLGDLERAAYSQAAKDTRAPLFEALKEVPTFALGLFTGHGAAGGGLAAGKYILQKYGNQALQGLGDAASYVQGLRGNMTSTLAKGMEKTGLQLTDGVRDAFTSQASGALGAVSSGKMLLDNILKTNELNPTSMSDSEKIKALQGVLLNKTADPNDPAAQIVASFGAPNTGTAIQQKSTNLMTYLQQIAPKQDQTANPFYKQNATLPDYEVQKFYRQLEIMNNPMLAFDRIKQGSLTPEESQTIQTVYPTLYDAMVTKMNNMATATDKNFTFQQQMMYSIFTHNPVNPSLQGKNIIALQSNYMNQPQKPQAPNQTITRASAINPSKTAQSTETNTQRITYS